MLKNLILQLGNTIRYYDEGQHSEHWTQDGDYISGYDLDTMTDQELVKLHFEMSVTLKLLTDESWRAEIGSVFTLSDSS